MTGLPALDPPLESSNVDEDAPILRTPPDFPLFQFTAMILH
jgi:hypothetical protein